MRQKRISNWLLSFGDIFNTRDDMGTGRVIQLGSTILTALYNVFITGIFYTGFLTMYGMSITDAGIISFIPYVANLFSIFSGKILGRFPRPKKILLISKTLYYALYILATTAMPMVVKDPDARLICFVAIIFVAYAVYAPFAPGLTAWFYNFYPTDNARRAKYLTLLQIFSSVMSSLMLLFSSLLTDRLSDSPYQQTLIVGLRYFAFLMVLVDIFMQSRAKEYPSPDTPGLKLVDVFTLPFKYKKLLACTLLCFVWNLIANMNAGVWHYHLLNHYHFPYILINSVSVMYTVLLILISPLWRRAIGRHSWVRTFGIGVLMWGPTEILCFFFTPQTLWMYIPLCVVQNIISVGLNISYANIFYTNLPKENATTLIAFHTIGCNLCAFLSVLTGTWMSGVTGDESFKLFGMDYYSVQFTVLTKGILCLFMGAVLVTQWRRFTNDQDVVEIEEQDRRHREYRNLRREMRRLKR